MWYLNNQYNRAKGDADYIQTEIWRLSTFVGDFVL